ATQLVLPSDFASGGTIRKSATAWLLEVSVNINDQVRRGRAHDGQPTSGPELHDRVARSRLAGAEVNYGRDRLRRGSGWIQNDVPGCARLRHGDVQRDRLCGSGDPAPIGQDECSPV